MQWRGYFDFGVAMQEGCATRMEIVPFAWHRGKIVAA